MLCVCWAGFLSSLCPSPQVDLRASPMGAAQDNHGTTTHYSSSNQHEISTGTGVLNWSDSSEWKLMTGNCSSWEIHGNGRSDENCSSMFAPVWMIFFFCAKVSFELLGLNCHLQVVISKHNPSHLQDKHFFFQSAVRGSHGQVCCTFSPLCFYMFALKIQQKVLYKKNTLLL